MDPSCKLELARFSALLRNQNRAEYGKTTIPGGQLEKLEIILNLALVLELKLKLSLAKFDKNKINKTRVESVQLVKTLKRLGSCQTLITLKSS